MESSSESTGARSAALKAAHMARAFRRPLHIVSAVQKVEVHDIKVGREQWHFDSVDIANQTPEKVPGRAHQIRASKCSD